MDLGSEVEQYTVDNRTENTPVRNHFNSYDFKLYPLSIIALSLSCDFQLSLQEKTSKTTC